MDNYEAERDVRDLAVLRTLTQDTTLQSKEQRSKGNYSVPLFKKDAKNKTSGDFAGISGIVVQLRYVGFLRKN